MTERNIGRCSTVSPIGPRGLEKVRESLLKTGEIVVGVLETYAAGGWTLSPHKRVPAELTAEQATLYLEGMQFLREMGYSSQTSHTLMSQPAVRELYCASSPHLRAQSGELQL